MDTVAIYEDDKHEGHTYILDLPFAAITDTAILQRSGGGFDNHPSYYKHIIPEVIDIDSGVFYHEFDADNFPQVTAVQNNGQLQLTCGCKASHGRLCQHQTALLTALIKKNDLRIYFDARLRDEKLRKVAFDYGLENEPDLDVFLKAIYAGKQAVIVPRLPSLIPVLTK